MGVEVIGRKGSGEEGKGNVPGGAGILGLVDIYICQRCRALELRVVLRGIGSDTDSTKKNCSIFVFGVYPPTSPFIGWQLHVD